MHSATPPAIRDQPHADAISAVLDGLQDGLEWLCTCDEVTVPRIDTAPGASDRLDVRMALDHLTVMTRAATSGDVRRAQQRGHAAAVRMGLALGGLS